MKHDIIEQLKSEIRCLKQQIRQERYGNFLQAGKV